LEVPVSNSIFKEACKKNGVRLSNSELEEIFKFFMNAQGFLKIEELLDVLCGNFNLQRAQAVEKMFQKIDSRNSQQVKLSLLQDLFNPKSHPLVKKGRKTQYEINEEWIVSVDKWRELEQIEEMNQKKFTQFWKLVSNPIKNDQDFLDMIDSSFRYSELSKYVSTINSEKQLLSESGHYQEIELLLRIELAQKGNSGPLKFFCNLKSKDHDQNGLLNFKEFDSAIKLSRLSIKEKDKEIIFRRNSLKGLLDLKKFTDLIVVKFPTYREQTLLILFDKLGPDRFTKKINVDSFEKTFFARGHPDFKRMMIPDYELKQEFNWCLRQFLLLYQETLYEMSLNAFMRFFEFYSFSLDDEGFYQLVDKAFKFKNFNKNFNKPQQYEEITNQQPSRGSSRYWENMTQYSEGVYGVNAPGFSASQFSPHDESVISRRTESSNLIQFVNDKIQKANFKKVEVKKKKQMDLWTQFQENIRRSANFSCLLELEYQMTKQSDEKGNVDFDVFSLVIEKLHLMFNLNEDKLKALYMESLIGGVLHVQTFMNDIRGQIFIDREKQVIDLFNRIKKGSTIHLKDLKDRFTPTVILGMNFKNFEDKFLYLLDLFEYLNLHLKNTKLMDLDDFLYLFDNVSFMIDTDTTFKEFLNKSF
jgi:hypothetical protein